MDDFDARIEHVGDATELETYGEFQAYMAKYGFIACPLTEEQHGEARKLGANDADMYGIGCDVNAGVDFHVAVKLNTQRYVAK